MKNLYETIKEAFLNRPIYKTYKSMPDNLLLTFLIFAGLPALYWGYILKSLIGPYMDAVDAAGFFHWEALFATSLMGGIAINFIFFAWVAKRSGELLYQRWMR